MLGQRRTRAGQSLMKEQRVLMYEAKRNKLGEATGFVLNPAQQEHLPYPMLGGFDVSIHHRRSCANAAAMCCADHFSPSCRRELVAREDKTDFVVKNFCGGAGQGIEAMIAQHGKVVGPKHARKVEFA